MSIRKYISEFSLHMQATLMLLLQQDDFDTAQAREVLDHNAFHIYLICKRPRITIDPELFLATPELICGVFKIQKGNTFESVPFVTRNETGYNHLRLEAPYPHNRFALMTPDGQKISFGKVGTLAHLVGIAGDRLDLEVLYVGQSYGTDGSRTAPERLRSHSTLQGIYAAATTNLPDNEIWLLLLKFDELVIASFDGTQKEYGTSEEQDREHIQNILRTRVSEQQKINFTEAALIRYFDAPYNKTYRDSFPSPAHGTYAACYDTDYNAVGVEVVTEELHCRLFSEKVAPAWWHTPHFPLHSREDRKSMFEIVGHDI